MSYERHQCRPRGGRASGGSRFFSSKESGEWNLVELMERASKVENEDPKRLRRKSEEIILALQDTDRQIGGIFSKYKK